MLYQDALLYVYGLIIRSNTFLDFLQRHSKDVSRNLYRCLAQAHEKRRGGSIDSDSIES